MNYRNIFEFPPGRFFGGFRRRLLGVVGVGGVLALGDRGPLVKKKMRTVITVRSRVIVIGVGIRGSGRGRGRRRYVDPLLLPLPHWSGEHCRRSVPGRGPSESGPNSLHDQISASDSGGDSLRSASVLFYFLKKVEIGFWNLDLEFSLFPLCEKALCFSL